MRGSLLHGLKGLKELHGKPGLVKFIMSMCHKKLLANRDVSGHVMRLPITGVSNQIIVEPLRQCLTGSFGMHGTHCCKSLGRGWKGPLYMVMRLLGP